MAITVKVNGTNNSLAHKGSNGFAKSTLPDVCKTPSPGGPVPIPYPIIISLASNLANGTTTVKADGGNSIAIKGSELSRCSGDEPGTAGGVKSSTNMKEATWILYSPTVRMEGKNACRLGDKLFMNHQNTVCLGGWTELPVIPEELDPDDKVRCAIWCCDQVTYRQTRGKKKANDCQRLANKKHSCVHHALKTQGGENVVSAPRFTEGGKPLSASAALLKKAGELRGKKKAAWLTPDVLIKSDPPQLIDAKFIPCKDKDKINEDLGRTDGRIVMDGSQSLQTAGGPIRSAPKETDLYPDLKVDGKPVGKNNVTTMTPEKAKKEMDAKGVKCDCETKPGTKEDPPDMSTAS
jgi:hypothetical protein